MWPQAIERPGHDQLFQNTAVELFNIGAGAQVEQIFKIPLLARIARFDNRFDRPFPHAFDGADAVDDLALVINVEVILPAVDVRRQDFQAHAPALIHQPHHLIGVIHIGGHNRGHKLGRIVGLQPQRLVRHQRIGSGVRFVKAVTRELLYQIEDFYRQFAVNAARFGTIFKTAALLGHLDRVLFTHGTTQHVRSAQRIACQYLSDLHYLFLVQDDAIGRLQHRLQRFMLPLDIRVGDLFAPVLTVDKVIYHAGL
ncbi:hypothetical protein D3C73_367370 [compost metagenome]